MSLSSEAHPSLPDLAMELSAICLNAIEDDRVEEIPTEYLGQIFASVLTVLAAKAQKGEYVAPFGRNSNVTVTDVAIGCTAMLDAVGLALFELGAWQSMAGVGRKPLKQFDAI